jgi:hypothetical protein
MKQVLLFVIAILIFSSALSIAQNKKYFSDYTPGMSNAKLEQQAVDAINQKAENDHWKERYTKAIITSYDWVIENDEYTRAVICRKLYMMLYGVWPEGKCKAVYFGFR